MTCPGLSPFKALSNFFNPRGMHSAFLTAFELLFLAFDAIFATYGLESTDNSQAQGHDGDLEAERILFCFFRGETVSFL
jgi:hypothetical protein